MNGYKRKFLFAFVGEGFFQIFTNELLLFPLSESLTNCIMGSNILFETISMIKKIKKFITRRTLIVLFTCAIIPINVFFLFVHTMSLLRKNEVILEPGSQFENFKKPLQGVKYVGYLTSKDTSEEDNDGAFLQAQYYLAPTIIELQNNSHQYQILDSENLLYIVYMMKTLKAVRITNNEYGQALIKKRE